MSHSFEPPDADEEATFAVKSQLDGYVVSVELTLVSIVQGSALGYLISTGLPYVVGLQWEMWPYIGVSLLFILIFWSSAVAHTLSFISWPLDFTHNFLYVAVTLVETWAIAQIGDVPRWYLLCAAYSASGLLLYATDLRLIRLARDDFRGPTATKLHVDLVRDQEQQVWWFLPGAVVFHLCAWLAVVRWPDALVTRGGHVVLGLYQLGVFAWFLRRGVLSLRRRQGWIFQRLVEQRRGEHVVIRRGEHGIDTVG
jgi:hypothetical protein